MSWSSSGRQFAQTRDRHHGWRPWSRLAGQSTSRMVLMSIRSWSFRDAGKKTLFASLRARTMVPSRSCSRCWEMLLWVVPALSTISHRQLAIAQGADHLPAQRVRHGLEGIRR